MNQSFFSRNSLRILCVVFFLVPFALRGARLALQNMKNDVKDWLPSDFPETRELAWFGEHFVGERFIVATWDGCTADDDRFQLLVRKLQSEIKPREDGTANQPQALLLPQTEPPETSASASLKDDGEDGGLLVPEVELGDPGELAIDVPQLPDDPVPMPAEIFTPLTDDELKAREVGDKYGLYTGRDYFENWGQRNERWLKGDHDIWYFVTPDGDLYEWGGRNTLIGWLQRSFKRNILGDLSVDGKHIAKLGENTPAEEKNPFFEDPRSITARYFASLTTGPQVMAQLAQEEGPLWPRDPELSHDEKAELARKLAMERLRGTLFGPDGKQTCIILTLSEPGKRDLARVIGRPLLGKPMGKLYQVAVNECGIKEEELRLGGPPVDNVAIDEEGQITLANLVGYSAAVGLVLSFVCFRSFQVTAMVFFVGGVSAITSLSIVFWSGASVDAILMSMPSLVYVLGLSGAVHIVNYYRDACQEEGADGATVRALGHGMWPCSLAAFTTSLGLLSLLSSNILPIRKFGLYSAVGVLATLLLLFSFLPSALEIWSPGYEKTRRRRPEDSTSVLEAVWQAIGRFVVRNYVAVALVCGLATIGIGLGLSKTTTSVQLLKLFDGGSKIIQDYTWLESNLGKLVPMELVLRIKPEATLASAAERDQDENRDEHLEQFQYTLLERLELTSRVQEVVEREFGEQGKDIVGRAMSAATLTPELPPPAPPGMFGSKRSVMNRKLEASREQLLGADYLRMEKAPAEANELWRISLRLGALNDVDYGVFVHEIKTVVEPVLSAHLDRNRMLRAIDEKRPDGGFRGARVCIIGANPAPQQPNANPADDATAASGQDAELPAASLDQKQIYTETLHDLLINAGFDGRYRARWIGLGAPQFKEIPPEKWEKFLAAHELVVLMDDVPDFEASFWKEHAANFIDLRDSYKFVHDQPDKYKTAAERDEAIQVIYTGVVPVVYKAQRTLLESLIYSIGVAFLLIAGVMMVQLRSGPLRPTSLLNIRGGMLSMIPNVFPVLIIFGVMGHLRIKIDIGSMMTASVAMGVAVDDTIHFLNWFRYGIKQGMTRQSAIELAYRRVASAMTQTTLIGGLGLCVFALSTFTPTQRFGVLMLALLAAALVGDLILLPAMLASPLGKCFAPKVDPEEVRRVSEKEAKREQEAELQQEGEEPEEPRGKIRKKKKKKRKSFHRHDGRHH